MIPCLLLLGGSSRLLFIMISVVTHTTLHIATMKEHFLDISRISLKVLAEHWLLLYCSY